MWDGKPSKRTDRAGEIMMGAQCVDLAAFAILVEVKEDWIKDERSPERGCQSYVPK